LAGAVQGRFYDTARQRAAERFLPPRVEHRLVNPESSREVTLFFGNSPAVIGDILERIPEPICFLLDAHMGWYWPLLDEIRRLRSRPESTIIIHDFKVPGKPFGHDRYYWTDLDWDYVKKDLHRVNPNFRISFNEEVSGPHSRGVLYATPS
jgi:hypothetical protein